MNELPDNRTQTQWNNVDRYLCDCLLGNDAVLESALKASQDAGLPAISVSPNQGKLLHLLARLTRARKILEIGTLGAYSTIWLARALPKDGLLITLENEPLHAKVATANLVRANLTNLVQLRLGAASESLSALVQEQAGPFDFIFIDADKPSYPDYLKWSLQLARPGTMIIADNIVRNGDIIDDQSSDPKVQGVRQFNQLVSSNPRLNSTAIQTVGTKGYDGFLLAEVLG